jgi:hypothetical protein
MSDIVIKQINFMSKPVAGSFVDVEFVFSDGAKISAEVVVPELFRALADLRPSKLSYSERRNIVLLTPLFGITKKTTEELIELPGLYQVKVVACAANGKEYGPVETTTQTWAPGVSSYLPIEKNRQELLKAVADKYPNESWWSVLQPDWRILNLALLFTGICCVGSYGYNRVSPFPQ